MENCRFQFSPHLIGLYHTFFLFWTCLLIFLNFYNHKQYKAKWNKISLLFKGKISLKTFGVGWCFKFISQKQSSMYRANGKVNSPVLAATMHNTNFYGQHFSLVNLTVWQSVEVFVLYSTSCYSESLTVCCLLSVILIPLFHQMHSMYRWRLYKRELRKSICYLCSTFQVSNSSNN